MILVTGGTGLLGSHLLYKLTAEGKDVMALKRVSSDVSEAKQVFSYYPNGKALFEDINWVDGDILNYADILELMEDVDEVYHCAAIVSFEPKLKAKMIEQNMKGTAHLVDAALAHGVKKFLHVSSTSAIGKAPEGQQCDETMVWAEGKSNTGYSISKFRSEMEVWRGIEEGLNAVIVNPSIILGPGFWDRGSSSIFSTINKGMRFYTKGITGYVGVWDVVDSMYELMKNGISGERYLLTTENYSYKAVFEMVAEAINKPKPRTEATIFLGELAWRLDWLKGVFGGTHTLTKEKIRSSRKVRYFSNAKIKETIGMEFEPIEEVIEKVAGFYIKNKPACR